MERRQVMELLAKAGVAAEKRFNIPAELICAQAALESGWLKHAPGNNCFGIKWSKERHAPEKRQLLKTREWMTEVRLNGWLQEVEGRRVLRRLSGPDSRGRFEWEVMDWFATYDNLEEALSDHGLILSRAPRYQQRLATCRTWQEACDAVAAAGYATDPQYAEKLKAIMTPQFQQVIAEERKKLSV